MEEILSLFLPILTKNSNKKPYQLDYLFIPKNIKLIDVKVEDKNKIFNTKSRLSDHLPIVAIIDV